MPTACHLSGMVNFRRTIPNQQKMKLKTLHKKNQLSFGNTNVEKYMWHFTHPPSWNASATTHKTSTVDITSSTCSIWQVTWSFGVDYSHMETGPLVWWKSFCYALPTSCKGLVPTKHFISGQPHFGGGGVTVWGCFSFDCKLYLYVLDGNLTGQKYRDHQTSGPVSMCEKSTPNDHVTCQIEHVDDVMSTVDVLWVVALAFHDGGGVWLQCVW
jgi:hypothetical protein